MNEIKGKESKQIQYRVTAYALSNTKKIFTLKSISIIIRFINVKFSVNHFVILILLGYMVFTKASQR